MDSPRMREGTARHGSARSNQNSHHDQSNSLPNSRDDDKKREREIRDARARLPLSNGLSRQELKIRAQLWQRLYAGGDGASYYQSLSIDDAANWLECYADMDRHECRPLWERIEPYKVTVGQETVPPKPKAVSNVHTLKPKDRPREILWLNQVVLDRDLPASSFRVAYVISQLWARDKGYADPSQVGIATVLGISERYVRNLVKPLVDNGHLAVGASANGWGRGHRSTYRPIIKEPTKPYLFPRE
jgi:hypothetical protein